MFERGVYVGDRKCGDFGVVDRRIRFPFDAVRVTVPVAESGNRIPRVNRLRCDRRFRRVDEIGRDPRLLHLCERRFERAPNFVGRMTRCHRQVDVKEPALERRIGKRLIAEGQVTQDEGSVEGRAVVRERARDDRRRGRIGLNVSRHVVCEVDDLIRIVGVDGDCCAVNVLRLRRNRFTG